MASSAARPRHYSVVGAAQDAANAVALVGELRKYGIDAHEPYRVVRSRDELEAVVGAAGDEDVSWILLVSRHLAAVVASPVGLDEILAMRRSGVSVVKGVLFEGDEVPEEAIWSVALVRGATLRSELAESLFVVAAGRERAEAPSTDESKARTPSTLSLWRSGFIVFTFSIALTMSRSPVESLKFSVLVLLSVGVLLLEIHARRTKSTTADLLAMVLLLLLFLLTSFWTRDR